MPAIPPKRIEDFRKKDDLIVVTGAGGFIAGSLVRYFHDKGFTRIRAVDKKPLDEWYQRTPGVEDLVPRRQRPRQLRPGLRGGGRGLQPGRRHGRHGLHRALPHRVPPHGPHQHPHDRGRPEGRRRPLLLLLLRLRLQHRPAEGRLLAGPQGIRRLPGHGRTRLRLGEALLGDGLPGILGRARPQDGHRPVPQRLRPPRHLGRRARESPGRAVPQGHRGHGRTAASPSSSGATGRGPAASCGSATASKAST